MVLQKRGHVKKEKRDKRTNSGSSYVCLCTARHQVTAAAAGGLIKASRRCASQGEGERERERPTKGRTGQETMDR